MPTLWIDILGYVAALCTLVTYSMKTMIPLRIAGIVTNVLFIAYAYLGAIYPALILHIVLLPLNATRLYQMMQLVRKVGEASQGDLSIEWLKPFMVSRRYRKGEILFRKGDIAAEMLYIVSGRYRLIEIGKEMGTGQVIGEIGIVTPENRRTQGIECIDDGEVLTISYDQVRQLYFQNPKFGFYLLRLIGERLSKDATRNQGVMA